MRRKKKSMNAPALAPTFMADKEKTFKGTKHSFDSDTDTTPILADISEVGLNKTMFINACIKLAWREAAKQIRAQIAEIETRSSDKGHKGSPR
jgi:hypothetical protein